MNKAEEYLEKKLLDNPTVPVSRNELETFSKFMCEHGTADGKPFCETAQGGAACNSCSIRYWALGKLEEMKKK